MSSYDNLTTIARASIANTSALIARIANILTLKVLETRTTIARASIANAGTIISLYDLLSSVKVFISNTFFSRTFDSNVDLLFDSNIFFLSIKESLATFSLRSLS